jgi:DNA adenine methylase
MAYPGGKGASGAAQAIINQQPPHDRYFELFLGDGAVMRAKRPARISVGNDIDPVSLSAFERTYKGNVRLCGMDAMDFLSRGQYQGVPFNKRDLIYLDPPYPLGTRRSARSMYHFEMSDEQHLVLLDLIKRLPCMVQISSYAGSMYSEKLNNWRRIEFQAMTRGGAANEFVWMNYGEPPALHDYHLLGHDFRERERIRRKVLRWTVRIGKLAPLERLALMSAMSAEIDTRCDVELL